MQNLKMEITIVNGFPLIKETGALEIRRSFFGDLAPGDQIKIIGRAGKNGKITSSHRIDEWDPFITYRGMAMVKLPGCPSNECLIFQLPGDGIREISGRPVDGIFYVSYYFFGRSLMRNQYGRSNSTRIFSSDFFTVDGIHIKG